MTRPIRKLLVANRGEIAVRVMRTAHALGIRTVAVFSDADRNALFVRTANEAVHIGPAASSESYLNADRIIAACKQVGADAVHPGYGFLSENPEFAERLADEGICFIGPGAEAMRAMALKGAAKSLMENAGVPVVPGYHGTDQSDEHLVKAAREIGLPVLFKAVAGGGGKGMRTARKEEDLLPAIQAARREGENSFGNGTLLVEKFIERPRHIEIQVFGDSHGHAVHLWERDCSVQRRHQKVIEEAPAPGMTPELRQRMGASAVKAAEAIGYQGAGTVEFIVDVANGLAGAPYYFMEMNTRLQVEHPVTELITGEDLVAWQIRIAEGEALPLSQDEIDARAAGHAVEVRLYAEDPERDFTPQTGDISLFGYDLALERFDGLRFDTGLTTHGGTVSVHYDPMLAKVIAYGEDRSHAIDTLIAGLRSTPVVGLRTNRDFLIRTLDHKAFRNADLDTGFIQRWQEDLLTRQMPCDRDLAAAATLITAPGDSSQDTPWDRRSAFRLNLAATQTLYLMAGDDVIPVRVTWSDNEAEVDVHKSRFKIAPVADSSSDILVNGQSETVHLARLGPGRFTVTTPRGQFKILEETPSAAAGDDGDGPGALTAPMPGKVLALMVEDGASVARGDTLLVLEAMKMEQSLKAPKDGVVSGLSLSVGDLVADGDVLLTVGNP